MNLVASAKRREDGVRSITKLIEGDANVLSAQLQELRERLFPPAAEKQLRKFSSGEAARLIGCSDGYLRQLSLAGEGPEPEKGVAGRRLYTLAQIHEIRCLLAKAKPSYLPIRPWGNGSRLLR